MSSVDLKLDWATHEAAKYACENWHYSKCTPHSKQSRLGVWESGKFIGVVMIGNSSGNTVFEFLGLNQINAAELTRIALKRHVTPVSKIIAIALKMVSKANPGLKAIVSFADKNVGHIGSVYQASNWKYFGRSTATKQWFYGGRWRNDIKLNELFRGKRDQLNKLPSRKIEGKYKYVYFLDKNLEAKFKDHFIPYPKRAESKANVAPTDQVGEGGVTPTSALQKDTV